MPTLPLYDDAVTVPGAWRNVIAPGGYQLWRLDAIDRTSGAILCLTFYDGRWNDRAYQHRYHRFRRAPTQNAPPRPEEFRAVEIDIYLANGSNVSSLEQSASDDFEASRMEMRVRIGPYSLQPDVAGIIKIAGPAAQLTVAPTGIDGTLGRVNGVALNHPIAGDGVLHSTFSVSPPTATCDYRMVLADRAIVGSIPGADRRRPVTVEGFDLEESRTLSEHRVLLTAPGNRNTAKPILAIADFF